MKPYLFALMGTILCLSASAQKGEASTFETLIDNMQGAFSSEAQAKADTNYHHITLDMQRIWPNSTNGAWLYVEQTAAWTPGKPYRQRIYHLTQQTDSTFTSTIYKMGHPENYVGGHLDPGKLDTLTEDSLEVLRGCALQLTHRDGVFSGATVEGACENAWGKATYATSEVSVYSDRMVSWDRGWNNDKEQVWGATEGGYIFEKVPRKKK